MVTTFRLEVARPTLLDLSQLSAMHVTIDCIGYAAQGSLGPTAVQAVTAEVRSSVPVMAGKAVSLDVAAT